MILSTCRKPLCLFAGKNSSSPPILFWRYCKDMQTSYFEYFGHAWLHTSKMIKSTCTRLWCLSVCKKHTLHFKESWQYRELEFCQTWDWWWNINNNISFHFRSCTRRNNDKFFSKNPKRTYFGAILGPSYPNFGKNEFSWEKELYQFLDIPIIYHCAKN